MAAILKSNMVVIGNDIVRLYFNSNVDYTVSNNFVGVDLSSLYLKVAKKA